MNSSLPCSSVHGILQARMLEWVTISFSRGASWQRDKTHISCIGRQVFLPLSHQGCPTIQFKIFLPTFQPIIFLISVHGTIIHQLVNLERSAPLSPLSLSLLPPSSLQLANYDDSNFFCCAMQLSLCTKTTEPTLQSPWAATTEPMYHNCWSPSALEPVLHNEKPLQWEACTLQRRVSPTCHN